MIQEHHQHGYGHGRGCARGRGPVCVIGAGIIGAATAIWLQRLGRDVRLIDAQGPAAGASYGNAGMLASSSIVPVTTPGLISKIPSYLFDPNKPLFLRWEYLPTLFPWLCKYLTHANASDAGRAAHALHPIIGNSLADHQALANGIRDAEKLIKPSKWMYLFRDRKEFEEDQYGWSLRRKYGFSWDEIGNEEIRALEPSFSDQYTFATMIGNHGSISDPPMYVNALVEHIEKSGGKLQFGNAVKDFEIEGSTLKGLRLCDDTVIECDAAVVATGVWSRDLAKKFGLAVPLESERGYHMEFWSPNWMPMQPVTINEGKFILTPMEGRLRAAGVVEFGGLLPASDPPFEFLKRTVAKCVPNLKYERVTRWQGHRPAPADSIPIIGELKTISGIFLGFGHHHVGLTGGAKTGKILAEMIALDSGRCMTDEELSVYSPTRFATR